MSNAWNMYRFAKEYKEYKDLLSGNGDSYAVDAALYALKNMKIVTNIVMQELERGSKMDRDICKEIKNVKFNPPATIVLWTDNTKTVVKCNGEDYDPEKGLAMCICKKVLGNKGNYYNVFKKWAPKEDEAEQNRPLKLMLGAFDNPKTFTFELKPVSDKAGLFSDLIGTNKEFQINFKTEKDVEEKKEKRNCSTCKFFDEDSGCMSTIVYICTSVDEYSAWEPKDE